MPRASASSNTAITSYRGQVPAAAILNAFDVNNRINCYLIENLPAEA